MLNLIKEIKKDLENPNSRPVKKYNVSDFTFEQLRELFTLAHENGLDTGCHLETGTLDFSLKH